MLKCRDRRRTLEMSKRPRRFADGPARERLLCAQRRGDLEFLLDRGGGESGG
jgi:hypothetical protein